MMRQLFACFFLLIFSCSLQAQEEKWVSDWRLEKPFIHGLISGISLNTFKLTPQNYKHAKPNEPNVIAFGMVSHIKENNLFTKNTGFICGISLVLFILLGSIIRFRLRFVISHFNQRYSQYGEDNAC